MNITLKLATNFLLKVHCRMLRPSLSTKNHLKKTIAHFYGDSKLCLELLYIFDSGAKLELRPLLCLSQALLSPFIIYAFYAHT